MFGGPEFNWLIQQTDQPYICILQPVEIFKKWFFSQPECESYWLLMQIAQSFNWLANLNLNILKIKILFSGQV